MPEPHHSVFYRHPVLAVCSWLSAAVNRKEDTTPALAMTDVGHVIGFTRTSALIDIQKQTAD